MDPRAFDGMIRKLSRALSRRSLVGGSLGVAVLSAVGLPDDARAKKIKAEDCLPPGQRCGTRRKDPPCRRCCQGYHVRNPNGSKKCACRPNGTECNNSSQCCTGTCTNGLCTASAVAPAPCLPAGAGCTSGSQCCVGICQSGVCGAPVCNNINAGCDVPSDCCSGVCGCIEEFFPLRLCTCRKSACAPPNGSCIFDSDCCTEFCFEGVCEEP